MTNSRDKTSIKATSPWKGHKSGKMPLKIDRWAHLCEECIFPDGCIRDEGDFAPYAKYRDYSGCVIWETAKKGIHPDEYDVYKYCYHKPSEHGVFCNPVLKNGNIIADEYEQLVKFEDGTEMWVERRQLRLNERCGKHQQQKG